MTESQATEVNSVLLATRNLVIGLTSDESPSAAIIRWCKELTAAGGEGMVVNPLEWIQRALRGLVQPAVKYRGREYSSTEITGRERQGVKANHFNNTSNITTGVFALIECFKFASMWTHVPACAS